MDILFFKSKTKNSVVSKRTHYYLVVNLRETLSEARACLELEPT